MLIVKRSSPLGILILAIVVVELFVMVPSTTEEFIAETFIEPNPQASLSIKGFSAVHLNQQGQKETISAKEAELYRKKEYAILKDVEAKIYAKGNDTILITGARGKYYIESKDFELYDDIVVVSEKKGYQLKTDYLRYEEIKSMLWSDQEFQLMGPNPLKPSFVATGIGMKVNTKTDEFNIVSKVHCKKYDEGAEGIEIDSETAKIWLDKKEALFMKNVVVNQKEMNLFTDNFLVNFNSETQSIDKAKAFDLVKIIQGNRVATCETAFLLNREKKIVMRGHPKVIQGDDVVEGKIVIFFTAENKILFDEAVGEMDAKRAKELN